MTIGNWPSAGKYPLWDKTARLCPVLWLRTGPMRDANVTTLAQISDVHLPPVLSFRPWLWNTKRILGLINWLRNRRKLHLRSVAALLADDIVAQEPDQIAVTGDLACLGLPTEFQSALTWLSRFEDKDRVSLIPGNHDIYTTGCDTACLNAWGEYFYSDAWGLEMRGQEQGFPLVRRVGPLAIIALNSSFPTRLFRAYGRVGERQLLALSEVLDKTAREGLIRVVLIHHPPLVGQAPRRRALMDCEEMESLLIEKGAELVVHGHNHRDSLRWVSTKAGRDLPVVGVATGSAGREHRYEPLARYNLYRFTKSGDGVEIELVTRGLRSAAGGVVELRRQPLRPDVALDVPAAGTVMRVP